jgi:DNA-binding CsgD family transcriptional regulator
MALVPRSVLEAVRQRTACLTSDAKRLLTIAAVAGRRFNVTLLQEMIGCDDTQLHALLKEVMAAYLVVEEEADRFAFRHALTQQAIYSELLTRERRALHRAIAETLERLATLSHTREQRLEDLAHHFYEAGAWQQAFTYAREASDKAQALYAQQATIEHLTHALDAAQHLGQTLPADLYLARGQAHGTLGEFDRAEDDYRRALEMARDQANAEREWQSMVALGFLWSGRDYEQAGQWFRQALDLTGRLGSPELRATSLNRLGNWLLNIGQCEGIVQAHEEALSIFEATANTRGMAESLDLLAIAHGLIGDRVKSVEMEGRAIALFRTLHDDEGLSSILATRAIQQTLEANETTYHTLHPLDETLRDADESLRLARQIGSLPAQAFAEIVLSYAHASSGNLGRALTHAHEALRIATTIEHRQWMAFASQATADIYLALRQPAQARATLDAGLGFAREVNSGIMTDFLASLLALAYLLERDLPHAEATLRSVMPREQHPRTLAERHVAWVWGELALAQGDPARALEQVEVLIDSAPGDQRGQPIPHLLLLKGNALDTLGRLDEASLAFADAQRGAELRQDQSVLWRIHAAHGRLLHRLKRDEAAQREISAAKRIIGALATTVEDATLREQFLSAACAMLPADRPISPRVAAKRAYGGLTTREREVAALVAQGKTSREIADVLVVSERTAEAHVGNILGKLGFTSRAQIAVWAVEHGLVAH